MFSEAHAEDSGHLDKPGGVDVNSHEDVFHAADEKLLFCTYNSGQLEDEWGREAHNSTSHSNIVRAQ